MTDVTIRRALLSVSDKAGLSDLGKALAARGVELVSTGGTAKALRDAGLEVKDVSDLTGFPEMMDGRVKTLHPVVHGGLLAVRDNPEHVAAMDNHGIGAIDLVRSAAKNHAFVTILTDPADYPALLAEIDDTGGATRFDFRRAMAAKAYAATAAYDAAIAGWFARADQQQHFPPRRAVASRLAATLRYGENPHQSAALYLAESSALGTGIPQARQLQGKELSYNNYNDANAALELVAEFAGAEPAVVIVKHANPCGVAIRPTLREAWEEALACDSVSAFGGIVATNVPLDGPTAEAIAGIFTEVVVAPGADEAAIAAFSRKKNLRLLLTEGLPDPRRAGLTQVVIAGGLLVQDRDNGHLTPDMLKVVTKRAPTQQEMKDCLFAWTVARHVKSNAIVYAKDGVTAGIGAGQMNRRDSSRIAAMKAREAAETYGWAAPRTVGSAVASDAFFPFADGLLAAAEAGATAVIQPGGSIRDDEVIAAADEAGLAMVFTGMRHFRH
jgi:phosphoribosylaminoimidazolecarboxamide formyltransferase/IMP cyclohydrolase